ncbi:hypothetical protein HK096_005922, partial [Nowakowskiella sp. JEL0078]
MRDATGQSQILCEKDYYTRKRLICVDCDLPIRGPHVVTQSNRKYHIEHFVCYACKEPLNHDSFFEEEDKVYCAKDYANLFAFKCAGCYCPLLEDFIETRTQNASDSSEVSLAWHPHCHELHQVFS